MTSIAVVGGHGYIGSRIAADHRDDDLVVVSREGATRFGLPSRSWHGWLRELGHGSVWRVIWLLDHRHDDERLLTELIAALPSGSRIAMASTCTVYGDQAGRLCDESTPIQPTTANAEAKLRCEELLAGSGLEWCSLRLGALFGPDHRGVRTDRAQRMVDQARAGKVVVPDPAHWRGWLHADQAARALWQASMSSHRGVVLVASENLTFGQAAAFAAERYDVAVEAAPDPDPCSYRIDSTLATSLGLLEVRPGESVADTIRAVDGSGAR